MPMQTPAPLTVLGLVALATTAIVCGDTAGKLLTGAGVQPLSAPAFGSAQQWAA
jgi:hypothetical protein